MFERYLFASWNAIAPALGNHLWQSTLVAVAVALLTLALRKQHARARYWLWLAASLKFLVPFSWLIALGSRLAQSPSMNAPALPMAIEELSQPFHPAAVSASAAVSAHAVSPGWMHLLPFLLVVWLSGFLAVLLMWAVRWLRLARVTRSAVPVSEGRELEILRRLERMAGISRRIALLSSPSSLEPGIFGIMRPVLLWPEGISRRLEDPHVEAILAHEVWHVRRRDNLFAALHMLVEAIFCFYPLVWWLGARLVEERERACDEEVVHLGSDRQVYAESILKVCEFCLGSPLFCVSGVTGANLKKRVVHIMTDRTLHKLDFARKLLLAAAAASAIALPITFGLFHPAAGRAQSPSSAAVVVPTFQSISIKPDDSDANGVFRTKVMFSPDDGSFTARGVTLAKLIRMAYHLQDSQLSGGPEWMNSQKYFVDAKLDNATVEQLRKQSARQPGFDDQAALKALLSDRFKLAFHMEGRTLPVYDLVVASEGPKLKESKTPRMIRVERGELTSSGIPIALLADELSRRLGQTVVDKTGLKSNYTFSLHWTPDANEDARLRDLAGPGPGTPGPEVSGPPIFIALQEQLGLKLEPDTETVQMLVIDHAEPPTEDQ